MECHTAPLIVSAAYFSFVVSLFLQTSPKKKKEGGRKGRAESALRGLYLGNDPLSCSFDGLSVSMKASAYLSLLTTRRKAL